MCGICGFIAPQAARPVEALSKTAATMATTLSHRGPDDSDEWCDESAGIALAHRRLSIVDLSPLGRQPMTSSNGRYVLTLNGEIYNHRTLRGELSGRYTFRGTSDTEVFLAAVEEWGIVEAVRRSVGMFAIAIWDRSERKLHLIRDRFGEKPLYYGWSGRTFLFGSELKALSAHPDWSGTIDRDALALFFRFNYIPAPYSIFKGIKKLPPASILTVAPGHINEYPDPAPYWSYAPTIAGGPTERFDGPRATDELDRLLRQAVREQSVADVPLGALLSGGIDSSTVVALMRAETSNRVRTFTIGFSDADFDEARDAAAVARHLGTDHTELYVSPARALDVIPSLPAFYDEPFADSSQIPTYLVSRLARQNVTVALSGDGGDELFGGYNRYFLAPRIWRKAAWLPWPLRSAVAAGLGRISPTHWRNILRLIPTRTPPADRIAERARKVASVLQSRNPEAVYRALVSVWHDPRRLVIGSGNPLTLIDDSAQWPSLGTFEERMMWFDAMTYLPDDILAKVDRAAMAVSLETRLPFLDVRVAEFASRLPLDLKIRNGRGKHLVRQVLRRYVPDNLVDRPKRGFAIPVGRWLRGELRDWAEDLLDERRVREEGFLDATQVQRVWKSHVDGRSDEQYTLWALLMFQAWLRSLGRSDSAIAQSF